MIPAVRTAIWEPSRIDQTATNVATSHCRRLGLKPAIGHSAPAAPVKPSENVQMVSTQPELPVRCCTSQAPAIRTDSATAIAARAPKYEMIMQWPVKSG